MESSRALSELGLATPTSADAIRRAYLRAVRAHPPERDPDGFRLVREAYEVLKDSPWLWVAESPRAESDDADDIGGHEDEEGEPLPGDDDEPVPDTNLADEFPEPDLSRTWKELYGAMEAADFERAATIFMTSMSSRAKPDRVQVSPWQVLDCVLGLFAQGKYALGGELLNRLDEWTTHQGVHPGHVGAPTAARWTLLKELHALQGKLDGYVVRGLVKAVEAGEFSGASDVLERAQSIDAGLQARLSRLAPTIYAATWPHVTPEQETRRFFRWGSGWQFAWVGIVALQCLRIVTSSGSDEKTPDPPVTFRASERSESVEPTPRDSSGVPLPVADAGRIALERWNVVRVIDQSIQMGDCSDVREQWPLYLTALRTDGEGAVDTKNYGTRRVSALAMCPELEKELPEEP
jgi:hypothetical protein